MTLPNFILGGAPKAGTTSLYHYLAAHPDVFMSRVKEPDYFHKHYDLGLAWYAGLFEGRTSERAVGEASPGTLASPEAVDRIYALVPDMRFIFVLRDPVERAYSQYLFDAGRGVQPVVASFSTFIRDESNAWRNRVIELGMYASQLERYQQRFGRANLHLALFDDLKRDRGQFVREIYQFLGVASDVSTDGSLEDEHNVTSYPRRLGAYRAARAVWDPIRGRLGDRWLEHLFLLRSAVRDRFFTKDPHSKPPLSAADRMYLTELYREANRRLEDFLGHDLARWTKTPEEESA